MYKGQIPKNAKCIDTINGVLQSKNIKAWLYEAEVSLGYQSDYNKVPAVFIEVWYGNDTTDMKKTVWRYTGKEAKERNKWQELKKAIEKEKEKENI